MSNEKVNNEKVITEEMRYSEVGSVCPMCRKETGMYLTEEEAEAFELYQMGFGHIQDVLPMLNPFEREFLKTGYCIHCQELLFGRKAEITEGRWETV